MKSVNGRVRLRAFVRQYQSQKAAARALRISQPHLSRLLQGRDPLSEDMLSKLGLRQIVVEAR